MEKEVIIKGVKYVAKSEKAETLEGLEYVIIRTYSAGVHAGYLKEENGNYVTLINARRIWRWEGAASLSQLAMEGTSKPNECKFPCEVEKIKLQWIEIIPCTEEAKQSIRGVDIWAE